MLSRRLPRSKEELPRQFAHVSDDSVVWLMNVSYLEFYQVWLEGDFVFVCRPDGFTLATTNIEMPEKAVLLMDRLK